MIYLHSAFLNHRVYVWGESEFEAAEDDRWPYALTRERLDDVLKHISLPSTNECNITGWFPSAGRKPIPSSAIFGDVSSAVQISTKPYSIPARRIEDSIALKRFEIEENKIEQGLFYGGDFLYWARAIRFMRRLLAREKFFPYLENGQPTWMPFLAGEDHVLFDDLARSMPPFCRAYSMNSRNEPRDSSTSILHRFVKHFLNALIHQSARNAVADIDSQNVQDRWLHGLKGDSLHATEPEIQSLELSLKDWAHPVMRVAQFPYRVALRLEEPTAKRESWFVRYFLQKQDDPSLMIAAKRIWSGSQTARRILKSDFVRARENLLGELAQAGRIDGLIERSLHRDSPEGYETDTDGAWEFLETKAWILQESGYGILLPSWWGRKKRLALKGKAKASTPKAFTGAGEKVLIDFDWKFAIGDQEISYKELMALARLKRPLVQFRGKWVALRAEEVAAALEFWKNKKLQKGDLLDLLKLSFGQQTGELPVQGVEVSGWISDFLHNIQDHSRYQLAEIPANFHGMLRPYQHRGYSWLNFMKTFGFGACLADDMGLGKTVQTIAEIVSDREKRPGPFLIVCPTSVVGNWQRELERFAPSLRIAIHHGAKRKKGEAFDQYLSSTDVLVSSYSLLVRDFQAFQSLNWRAVILDEAQNIKNAETKQARAARSLQADFRIALTGTPVENNIGELWSIMEFLNPGLLGTKGDFQTRYFQPIHKQGDSEAMENLKTITGPFLLRRLKSDPEIISDLPAKMEMKVFCNLTTEQASLYAAVVRDLDRKLDESEGIERKGKILAALTRLKQICNHPAHFLGETFPLEFRSGKLSRLTEMLDEVLQVKEKCLIFTQFAQMGELLQGYLTNSFGVEVAFLHGGLVRKKREQLIDRFNNDCDSLPVFVLSLKAGGTGLNLTAANHVFHFDRWWNPAVENQATDRAYRIGQKKNVQVHKFVCVGTLEERIDQILERKKDMAEKMIGSGESWLTELSTTEIRSLIALSKDAVAV